MRRALAFFVFAIVGLALTVAFAMVFRSIPFVRQSEIFGASGDGILAVIVALPMADWIRKKVFGARSFGERI